MSDLALDADGDLLIERGDAVLATGALATAQDWARRLGLFRGEWPLDRRVGIDYQGLLLDGRPSQALLRHVFETVSRETAGIKTLDRLEFRFDSATRTLEVDAEATHEDGDTVRFYREVLFEDLAAGAPG